MKLREIERLRAYAILLAIVGSIGSLQSALPFFLQNTIGGAQLFFVISGFVIATSFLKTLPEFSPSSNWTQRLEQSRTALKAFFVRRFFRIMPLAIVWALIPLVASFFRREPGVTTGIARELLAIFTLQYNYAAAFGNGRELVQFWSLSVEQQFYLAFPLIMIACATFEKRLAAALGGVGLVVILLRPLVPFSGPNDPVLVQTFNDFASHRVFDFLLVGVAVALMRREGWGLTLSRLPRGLAAILGAFCLCALAVVPGVLPGSYVSSGCAVAEWSCAAVLVTLASFDRGLVLDVPVLRGFLEYVGSRSFALYLSHRFAIDLVGHVLETLHYNERLSGVTFGLSATLGFRVACSFAAAFALAEASYRLVEGPGRAIGRVISNRWLNVTSDKPKEAAAARAPQLTLQAARVRAQAARGASPAATITHERIVEMTAAFKGQRVLVFGDVGLDKYTVGRVSRISPEAPIPVVEVVSTRLKLGLASNVADNIRALGGAPALVGAVGTDRIAGEFKALLRQREISDTHLVSDSARFTTMKERVVAENQQLVRIDHETRQSVSDKVRSDLADQLRPLIEESSCVIIEDYAKGVVDRELAQEVIRLARARKIPVLVDPNTKTPLDLYKGCTLLTPNLVEAEALAGHRIDESTLAEAGQRIIEKAESDCLIITRGRDGMAIFEKGRREPVLIPTVAQEVFDVSGAGDTAIATLSLAMITGASLVEAAIVANIASGVEVGKSGTATVTIDEIVDYHSLLEGRAARAPGAVRSAA